MELVIYMEIDIRVTGVIICLSKLASFSVTTIDASFFSDLSRKCPHENNSKYEEKHANSCAIKQCTEVLQNVATSCLQWIQYVFSQTQVNKISAACANGVDVDFSIVAEMFSILGF